MEKHSLCPSCAACPEVIDADQVRIGEDANTVVLEKDEWNVLVGLITSGDSGASEPSVAGPVVVTCCDVERAPRGSERAESLSES
jgi:hypothetical protein